MTTLKTLLALAVLTVLFMQPQNSNADPGDRANTSGLNSQIIEEIKEILKTPYLKFSDKDLNGTVTLSADITPEGKIVFKNISGINENLVSNVMARLNSLNLWASPDFSSNEFTYRIKYSN